MSMSDTTSSAGSGTTTTTSTPSGSTESTGSVSAVGSTPATSESRPASFRDAFMAVGASDTPNPEATTPDPSAPAPATVEPVSAAADAPVNDATGQPAKGPIPFDRHEAILQNARDKTAKDVVTQVQQRYGGGIALQNAMQSDPAGTLTQLITEAVDHPDLGPTIISALARTLGARRNAGPDLTPIETEVGQVYTADQVKALVEQSIAQRVAPFERERQDAQKAEAARQFRDQTAATVKARLAQWETQPGFADHKSEIAAKQREYVQQGADTWTALGLAYAAVVPAKLQAKQTTQFVQDAMRKANASTSNPATVAPTIKPRPKTFREAFDRARGA